MSGQLFKCCFSASSSKSKVECSGGAAAPLVQVLVAIQTSVGILQHLSTKGPRLGTIHHCLQHEMMITNWNFFVVTAVSKINLESKIFYTSLATSRSSRFCWVNKQQIKVTFMDFFRVFLLHSAMLPLQSLLV